MVLGYSTRHEHDHSNENGMQASDMLADGRVEARKQIITHQHQHLQASKHSIASLQQTISIVQRTSSKKTINTSIKVFSTNFITSTLALASTLPLVFAGAVLPKAQDAPSTITRRETTWEAYHQTNAIFAEQGLCRYYIDATDRDGLWPCRQFCSSDSVTCSGDNAVTATNPNGERYYYGKCSCSNPILETIVDFTAEGLQGLPGITCAVWLEALKQSVEIGTWFIPGAGPAAKAAKTIVKTAKRADKLGGKDWWTNLIKDQCHIEQWDFDISKAFDLFHEGDEN